MWQVLVAAAVAGSGLVARNVFNFHPGAGFTISDQKMVDLDHEASSEICEEIEHASPKFELSSSKSQHSIPNSPPFTPQIEDAGAARVFRFSSSPGSRRRRSKKGAGLGLGLLKKTNKKTKGVEVQKLERRFSICLKKRKTGKSGSVDSAACSYNGDANALFGWGLGVGMMYMMSTGQAEMSRLSATMDQTVKVVGELRNEFCKRKASCISNSSGLSSRTVDESGEYPSSILTEEPERQHGIQEMDQLEADLEYELSKLTSCAAEASFDEGAAPELHQVRNALCADNGIGRSSNSCQFNGVEPSELEKKLSELLIKQQESQINELEYELQSANSKLHQKEAELRALKDCVRRLSSFSLSNISEDETEITVEQEMMSAD